MLRSDDLTHPTPADGSAAAAEPVDADSRSSASGSTDETPNLDVPQPGLLSHGLFVDPATLPQQIDALLGAIGFLENEIDREVKRMDGATANATAHSVYAEKTLAHEAHPIRRARAGSSSRLPEVRQHAAHLAALAQIMEAERNTAIASVGAMSKRAQSAPEAESSASGTGQAKPARRRRTNSFGARLTGARLSKNRIAAAKASSQEELMLVATAMISPGYLHALCAEVDKLLAIVAPTSDATSTADKINVIQATLTQERELQTAFGRTTGYEILKPLTKAFSEDSTQQIRLAKIFRRMYQLRSGFGAGGAGDADGDGTEAELIALTVALFNEQYDVAFLGSGNSVVARLDRRCAAGEHAFTFIIRLQDIYAEELGHAFPDARRKLFISAHAGDTTTDETDFDFLCKPYYCAELDAKILATPVPSDDDNHEPDVLAGISDDELMTPGGQLFFSFDEYFPGGNLEEVYAGLHAQDTPHERLIPQAFRHTENLTRALGALLPHGVTYTDSKLKDFFRAAGKPDNVRLGDIQGLVPFDGDPDRPFAIKAFVDTKNYTDSRIKPDRYKAPLAIKIAMIACLYHMLSGRAPDKDSSGLLVFDFRRPIFDSRLPINGGEKIGDFLHRHYITRESHEVLLIDLAQINLNWAPGPSSPTPRQAEAADSTPAAGLTGFADATPPRPPSA
jgi:hypothetical protein